MNEPEYVTIARELRAKGLTMQAIADHMNERGILSPKGQRWVSATAQRAVMWKSVTSQADRLSVQLPPQEILAADPNNTAAIADLEDRQRYFSTGNLSVERIRAINKEYQRR